MVAPNSAKKGPSAGGLTTEEVLREEAKAIHKSDLSETGPALYDALFKSRSAALCLSGGGIRSAAFALGVIQALAVHPRPAQDRNEKEVDRDRDVGNPERSLLAQFHYLSTVSGGGYIGSWLSAWVTRAGFPTVWHNLVGRPQGPDIEPQAVAWLRAYSNYLTPRLGVMSADTWTAATLVLRNLILNWLVIVPVLCLLILILKLFAVSIVWFSQFGSRACSVWLAAAAAAGCAFLIAALLFAYRNRPTRGAGNAGQSAFLWKCLAPAVLSGIFFSFALASPCGPAFVPSLPIFASSTVASMLVSGVTIGVVIYLVSWVAALPGGPIWDSVNSALPKLRDRNAFVAAMPPRRAWIDLLVDFIASATAGAVYGALMTLGAYLYIEHYGAGFWFFTPGEILLIVFGVPWALAAQLLASMIFVAVSNSEKDSDADREWIGRADGWLMVTALGWLIVMFLVFVGSTVAAKIYQSYLAWAAGGGSGAITAWLGKSSLTPAKGPAPDGKGVSANIVLAIAAPIFAAILIVMISAVLDEVLFGKPLNETESFAAYVSAKGWPDWPGGWSLLVAIGVALIVGAIASAVVNINRFSLHAMYRNRLIRGFLGASHADKRKPDLFTDFDFSDNPRMSQLWPPKEMWNELSTRGKDWQPFHIVNIALNVVSTKRLAWQERKAEPFTVSPLHSGCASGNPVRGADGAWVAHGAFRRSERYGGKEGISLGTALSISGAAASPNMGYNSSAALAFLMTLFNVRLGWWLGNPSKNRYDSEGPRFAIVPLLTEMFGQTTDERKYVYLSDGGHFENLGLYEMVRRRCRLIVISDAGCDPDFGFEDLGNAVRKVSLDLGVTITINQLEQLKRRAEEGLDSAPDQAYCAIGEIDYPTSDGSSAMGVLLYIKPGYHGVESAGIRAYAIANPTFPHQTTGDQFFSESQFESYRALGFEIVDGFLNRAFSGDNRPTAWNVDEISKALAHG